MADNEKKFADFQVRECDILDEEKLPPVICPKCVPNPNALVPIWYEEDEPFFNERDCLYQVAVVVNDEGEFLTPHEVHDIRKEHAIAGDESTSDNIDEVLGTEGLQALKNLAIKKGILQRGIRKLIRYYDKLESNETVCAFGGCQYDIAQMEKQRDSYDEMIAWLSASPNIDYKDASTGSVLIDQLVHFYGTPIRKRLADIAESKTQINPYGLEWTATLDDVHIEFYQTKKGGTPIKFLVSVPAHNFDMVPPDDSIDDEEESPADQVVLEAVDIKGQLLRFGTTLWVYSNYQKFFIDSIEFGGDGGRLYFKDEPGRNYNCLRVKQHLKEFRDKLIKCVHDNDYRFPFELGWGRELISKIRITFKNNDPEKLYIIKKIEVKAEGCRGWKKLKSKLPTGFKKDTNKPQRTIMGYISRMDEIDQRITARKTLGWIEFIQEFTYPQVKVDYGIADPSDLTADEKTGLQCILEKDFGLGTGKTRDYLLSEVLSMWDAIADEYNKKQCGKDDESKSPSIDEQRKNEELIQRAYEREIEKLIRKQVRDETQRARGLGVLNPAAAAEAEFNVSTEVWAARNPTQAKALMSKVRENVMGGGVAGFPYYEAAKMAALERFDYEDSLIHQLMSVFNKGDGDLKMPDKDDFKKELNRMGKCGLNKLLLKAIQCLLGGMNLQDALRAMIKAALEAMTGGDMGRLFVGLPYDKQQEILEKVEKEIGKVPPPWDEQFKAGEVETQFSSPSGGSLSVSQEEWDNYPRSSQNDLIEMTEAAGGTAQEGAIKEQGSIGEAAGNIQQIIVKAYIEAIMSSVGVETLLNELDKFPGAAIVAKLILSLRCPTKPLFSPSPADFLKTLTLDVCDPTIGITWPRLRRIPFSLKELLFETLKEIVKKQIKQLFLRILAQLIYKLLVTLESILCRSLAAVGQFAADAVNPNVRVGSLGDAFREAFCGRDADGKRVDEVMANTFDFLGFSSPTTPAEKVINAISTTATADEFLALMVTDPMNQDPRALKRMSMTISAVAPEFADVLGTPSQVSDLFSGIGNFITPEDRADIKNTLASVPSDRPINASVCLTTEEFDEWNDIRENILTDSGLTPEEAAEYVNGLNQRAEERLTEFVKDMANNDSPAGVLGDAFANLMDPNGTDPDCADSGVASILRPYTNDQIAPMLNSVANKVFDQVTIRYTRDVIGRRGILNYVLADKKDKIYTSHVRLTRNFLTGRFYADSEASYAQRQEDQWFPSLVGPIGMFPDTVCIDLRNKLIEQTVQFKTTLDTNPRKTWNVTPERSRLFPRIKEIDITTVRKKSKKAEFELGYFDKGEVPDPEDPEGDPIFMGYGIVAKYRNGIAGGDLGVKKNLNYQMYFGGEERTTSNTKRKWKLIDPIVERPPNAEEANLIAQIEGDEEWTAQSQQGTYVSFLFNKFIDSKWADAQGYNSLRGQSMYDGINTHVLNLMKDYLVTKPGADPATANPSEISSGFSFGYKYDPLVPENFEYVAPNGEEYDFDEEECKLGKMKKASPRVHILNPADYGGRYGNPKWYVDPPERQGWLGLAESLIPPGNNCEKEADLLDIEGIKRHVSKVAAGLPYDERLTMERSCQKEVPFDKIANATTHSLIEGSIKAISRVYLIQHYVTGMPAFANLVMTPGNYDDGFFEFVAARMRQSMREEGLQRPRGMTVRQDNYWLLFLEQCVQVYNRGVESGQFTPDERIKRVLNKIRKAQENYWWPEDWDDYAWCREHEIFELPNKVLKTEDIGNKKFYLYSLAYQVYEQHIFLSNDTVTASMPPAILYGRFLKLLRFATKILTIKIVEAQCIEVLKEILKAEANEIFTNFNERMKPRSPINNIQKYMLGLDSLCVGSTLKVGTTKYLIDKQTEGELADTGDIPHVISNPATESPLQAGGFDAESLNKSGIFVLEKYVRLEEKPDQANVPEFIKQRNKNLYGVVNLKDFQNFVNNHEQSKDYLYSDCFGDMKFLYSVSIGQLKEAGMSTGMIFDKILYDLDTKEAKEAMKDSNYVVKTTKDYLPPELADRIGPSGITGSVGVKYGIRICYVPPSGFNGANVSEEYAMQNKSYNVVPVGSQNTKYIFPIASGEVDLLDEELSNFNWKENQMDPYDLECMVDKLLLSPDFKMFFDRFVPFKSYTSFVASFISLTFLAALGEDDSERERDDGFLTPNDPEGVRGWDGLLFDGTRRTCRRIFAQAYNSNDFDPLDGEDITLRDFFNSINPFANVLPGFLSWWQKRNRRDKPDECGNPFADLFKS